MKNVAGDDEKRGFAQFILAFIFLGLMTKIVSELTHEAGHAVFVILLGGTIERIVLNFEWPFSVSHTIWLLEDSTDSKIALISIAGILSDLLVTVSGQFSLLYRKRSNWVLTLSVFWVSFWTYLNSVVYLVVGSVHPFGDLYDFVSVTSVPRLVIGAVGFTMFGLFTNNLSIILKNIFSNMMTPKWASNSVSLFWVLIHMIFILSTVIRYGLPLSPMIASASLVLIFTLSYTSGRGILFLISQFREKKEETTILETTRSQNTINEPIDREKREKIGYIIILSAALISILATGFIVNQYVSTYRLIMGTEVNVDVTSVVMGTEDSSLNITMSVVNPTKDDLLLKRVELDVKLNGKYMTHETITTIPPIPAEDTILYSYTVTLPNDRRFTMEEAVEEDAWGWTVEGTSYVDTMFGETLLRFKNHSENRPQ